MTEVMQQSPSIAHLVKCIYDGEALSAVATSTLALKKIAPGEIQISHHLFDRLKQTTKDQILFVHGRTMGPDTPLHRRALDSHSRIRQALQFLGVGTFEYDKKSRTTPDDLLTNWVHESYKLLFDCYEADPISTKRLKEVAFCRSWGLDELKAITAVWMTGKDEDMLLELGRKLMKIDDETRLKYQTSGRNMLWQANKTFVVERAATERDAKEEEDGDVEEVIREDLMPKGRNTGNKIKLDAETLKMIKQVREAQDSLNRRTSRLLKHVVNAPDFTDCSRLPPNRRLEAPQRVDYPWMNRKTRGRR